MAQEGQPIPLLIKPGIQRDSTLFDADSCVDGVWSRWVAGKPRKQGGYRQMTDTYAGPIRQLFLKPLGAQFGLFAGSPSGVEVGYFSFDGFGSAPFDVSPAGFTSDALYQWQFDGMYDPTNLNNPIFFAHPATTLLNPGDMTDFDIYYKDATDTSLLDVLPNAPQVSGGIVVLFPFLFAYGNNGYVAWSEAGDPETWTGGLAGNAYITENKIIRGVSFTSGVNASPGGLFWSQDKLYRATINSTGTGDTFSFDFVGKASLLGQDAVVEFNGTYAWAEQGRFCMYNGTIREIPNSMNKDFFFDNINPNTYSKVVGFTNKRYGEWGWMFCKGDATEPNWAVINIVGTDIWYDTPLPEGGRSAILNAGVFKYPIWAGLPNPGETTYALWQHEFGWDKIIGFNTQAIKSNFTTAMFSLPGGGWPAAQGERRDKNTLLFRVEPDFVQSGNMSVTVIARNTPKGADTTLETKDFSNTTGYVDFDKFDGRMVRLQFESNVQNGYYIMGNPLIHVQEGSSRYEAA